MLLPPFQERPWRMLCQPSHSELIYLGHNFPSFLIWYEVVPHQLIKTLLTPIMCLGRSQPVRSAIQVLTKQTLA